MLPNLIAQARAYHRATTHRPSSPEEVRQEALLLTEDQEQADRITAEFMLDMRKNGSPVDVPEN